MDRNNNRVFMFLSQKITIFEQQKRTKRIYKTQTSKDRNTFTNINNGVL